VGIYLTTGYSEINFLITSIQAHSLTSGVSGYLASINCGLEAVATGIPLVLYICATPSSSLGGQCFWGLLERVFEPACSTMSSQQEQVSRSTRQLQGGRCNRSPFCHLSARHQQLECPTRGVSCRKHELIGQVQDD
jgi:hypothetical protein